MKHRLEPLCLLPPPAGAVWSAAPSEFSRFNISRTVGQPVQIDTPLFWYDPPWYRTDPRTADMVATSVATVGVVVSALRSELVFRDEPVTLHELNVRSAAGQSAPRRNLPTDADGFLPRLVPYRPERYGLCEQDFDGASIIDVRLTPYHDPSGRYGFNHDQLERWETPPTDEEDDEADEPIMASLHRSSAPSAALPPDVPALDQLPIKLDQLRKLAPAAALFVSITPHRISAELPKIVAAGPDGVILHLDELPLSGMELALVTRAARRLLTAAGAASMPLWLVPGEISPDDAVKLMALGGSGVAIDPWCQGLIARAEQVIETSPAGRLQQGSQREFDQPLVREAVGESLREPLERFQGLFHRLQSLPANERLGSLDPQWAKTFAVPWISAGRNQVSKPNDPPAASS